MNLASDEWRDAVGAEAILEAIDALVFEAKQDARIDAMIAVGIVDLPDLCPCAAREKSRARLSEVRWALINEIAKQKRGSK